jgi:hypothetical protein
MGEHCSVSIRQQNGGIGSDRQETFGISPIILTRPGELIAN